MDRLDTYQRRCSIKSLSKFILATIVTLGGLAFVSILFIKSDTSPGLRTPEPVRSYDFEIRGLDYTDYVEGVRQFRFRADSLLMRKKRFGFFTIGLLNWREILINNASLDIYLSPKYGENSAESRNTIDLCRTENWLKRAVPQGESNTRIKIAKLQVQPIKVDFYTGQNLVSSLRADKGNFKEGKFLLKGDVVFKNSAGKTIKTKRLAWSTKTHLFSTDDTCVITSGNRNFTRKGMTFDLFLNEDNLAHQSRQIHTP